MIDSRLKPNTMSLSTTVTPVSSGPRWWMLSSASATASRQADACPRALTKVSSPHMAAILPRPRTGSSHPVPEGTVGSVNDENQGTESEANHAAQSHDPEYSERYTAFMRTGWRDTALDVVPIAQAPHHGKRRAAVAEAFPGETLV